MALQERSSPQAGPPTGGYLFSVSPHSEGRFTLPYPQMAQTRCCLGSPRIPSTVSCLPMSLPPCRLLSTV